MRLRCAAALLCVGFGLYGQDPGDIAFDFRNDSRFGNPTAGLKEFLQTQHARKGGQFCAVGFQSGDKSDQRVWIHWAGGKKLLRWAGAADPAAVTQSVAHSRVIDLTKDVVASDAQLQGSTYRVTREWVTQLEAACHMRGVRYEIRMK